MIGAISVIRFGARRLMIDLIALKVTLNGQKKKNPLFAFFPFADNNGYLCFLRGNPFISVKWKPLNGKIHKLNLQSLLTKDLFVASNLDQFSRFVDDQFTLDSTKKR